NPLILAGDGFVTKLAVGVDLPPVTPPPVPAAPTQLAPAVDASPAQPVTFDWSDVANAVSYTLQIDGSSTFTAPLVSEQSGAVSECPLTGLPAVRQWWRVRGVNAAGVAGAWTAARRFQPLAAPAAAALLSVSASAASVVGGNPAQGTVRLTAAAAPGGA